MKIQWISTLALAIFSAGALHSAAQAPQPTGQITEVKIQLPAEMAEPIGELWVNQGGYLVVSAFGSVTSRSCISLESR